MPREEIRSRKPTDIYSVMLIVAFVFLLGSILLVWHELDGHYNFMGSAAEAGETTGIDGDMGDDVGDVEPE